MGARVPDWAQDRPATPEQTSHRRKSAGLGARAPRQPALIRIMEPEDFSTLDEMKNGLRSHARVEELICVMHKQKDRATDFKDAARQWLTVASALASTDNKECLDHFVQSNGLNFVNQWLQEAVNHLLDGAVGEEELIHAIFGSLEKLPLCREALLFSGIMATVEKISDHKLVSVKEKARAFLERWADEMGNDSGIADRCKAPAVEPSIEGNEFPARMPANASSVSCHLEPKENNEFEVSEYMDKYYRCASTDGKKPFQSSIEHVGKGLEDDLSRTMEVNNMCREGVLKAHYAKIFGESFKPSRDGAGEEVEIKSAYSVEAEVFDCKNRSSSSSPEVSSREVFIPPSSVILESKQDCHIIQHGAFDLNAAASSDEPDSDVNLIPSIQVDEPASKITPEFSFFPLHLEGESATRNYLDGNNITSGSKQNRNLAEIDLNVASVEGEEKMLLDLNYAKEVVREETPLLFSSLPAHNHQNGRGISPPLAPSASSSTYPSARNVDLNRNPNAHETSGYQKSTRTMQSDKIGIQVAEPIITIFGSRMVAADREADQINDALPPCNAYNGLIEMGATMPFQPFSNGSSMDYRPTRTTRPLLSTRSFIAGMENRSNGDGRPEDLFMAEYRNLLGGQSSSSMNPLKRKEPESAWEPYGRFRHDRPTYLWL